MPFVLSFHAGYRCRDRGVCCSSGWPIPIEDDRARAVQRAMDAGRLVARHAAVPFAVTGAGPTILNMVDDACVFYGGAHGGCDIHHALGHNALPLACRQFPRISIRDPRGTSVTLSHYCPTAAAMLGVATSTTIEADPPGFPADGEYVGLDAGEALPPRLRPDMLMDWEGWWRWERLSVQALAESRDAEEGLGRLRGAIAHTRSWRPSDEPLASRIDAAFRARPLCRAVHPEERGHRLREILAAIPADIRPAGAPGRKAELSSSSAHRDFLIAHAFASWSAHLGQGLRTWLRAIEAADALIASGFDAGTADLWLRHLADPWALAEVWSEAEKN